VNVTGKRPPFTGPQGKELGNAKGHLEHVDEKGNIPVPPEGLQAMSWGGQGEANDPGEN